VHKVYLLKGKHPPNRREIIAEGLYTVPLGISFGNLRSYNEKHHLFEVLKTSAEYDALIPAWYLEKHMAR